MKVGRAARDRSRFEAPAAERLGEAFAGLKVADFSLGGRRAADGQGDCRPRRDVVRVESSTRVDYVRTLQPFKDGVSASTAATT